MKIVHALGLALTAGAGLVIGTILGAAMRSLAGFG